MLVFATWDENRSQRDTRPRRVRSHERRLWSHRGPWTVNTQDTSGETDDPAASVGNRRWPTCTQAQRPGPSPMPCAAGAAAHRACLAHAHLHYGLVARL